MYWRKNIYRKEERKQLVIELYVDSAIINALGQRSQLCFSITHCVQNKIVRLFILYLKIKFHCLSSILHFNFFWRRQVQFLDSIFFVSFLQLRRVVVYCQQCQNSSILAFSSVCVILLVSTTVSSSQQLPKKKSLRMHTQNTVDYNIFFCSVRNYI